MKSTLSPKELAQAIGVSESSLKRWADSGLLSVTKTAGGHRRIALSDAVRFIRDNHFPTLRANLLGIVEVDAIAWAAKSDGSIDESLHDSLLRGDSPRARGLILAQYLAGQPLAAIFDGPIRGAMARLGELWRHDDNGVFLEHRATDICLTAVNQLRLLLPPRAQGAPVALGGSLEEDPYFLPTLMAATVLAELGYNDMNLGPNTPADALLHAAEQCRPRLVWVSLSVTQEEHASRNGRAALWLAGRLAPMRTPVVLGGRGCGDPAQYRRPNTHVAQSMAELAAFARGLLAPSPVKVPASKK